MTSPARLTAYCSPHDNSLVIERVTATAKQRIKTSVALDKNMLCKTFPCYHGPNDHSYKVHLLGSFWIVVDIRAAQIATTAITPERSQAQQERKSA